MCNNDYLGLFLIYFSLYSCVYIERYSLHGMKILQKWLFHLVQGCQISCSSFQSFEFQFIYNILCFWTFPFWIMSERIPLLIYSHDLLENVIILMSNKRVLCFLIQFNQFVDIFYYGSRLKALNRMSRSPTLAAWNSSGWSIIDRAIRSAAQILPDRAGWGTCCWFLLFLCKLRAVRKLLTASL